jgi:hypothetical protein
MGKSHECHSEPQAKNLAFPATYEGEILRLSPQDGIATQSPEGEEVSKLTAGDKSTSFQLKSCRIRVRMMVIATACMAFLGF